MKLGIQLVNAINFRSVSQPLPTRPETPGTIEIAKSVPNSNDPFDAVTHVEEENSTMSVTEFTSIVAMSDQVKANLSHSDSICPVQPAEDIQPGPSGDSNKRKKQESQDMTEEEDVDLEDRPLTVDVPRESEVVSASPQVVSTSVECEPKQLTDHSREHVPTSPDLDISVSSAGSRMQVPDQSNETKPLKLASLSVRNVPPGSATMADSLDTAPPLNVTAPVTTSESTLGPKIQEYPVQSKTIEDQPCTVTVVLDQTTSRPHTPSLSSSAMISLNSTVETSDRPSAFPVSTIPFGPTKRPASVHSECDRLPGGTTPSVTGLPRIPSASPMPGTAAVVPQPSSLTSAPTLTSPMTLTSQSTVQLMPFVATTTMLNNLTPDPTAPGVSTIPQPGTATNGPSSLIFNMTPMPQFVGMFDR
ncbi:hypothetical protein FGIG_00118 [Fasciola gigantica]|uniref:Uncharacterized protein n=1 Tax=Fasciola gigantica TaxID=46835 RepID=A0A504YKT1_FASGI|nr:hypothetical protein FGIG_00118 [Fasciola gigantica]